MNKRMKGFTCCGDCIHYNYKKHKCNLGASVETDARNHFYDDCPISDIPSEQEIRNKAIDEFVKEAMKQFTEFDLKHGYPTITDCKMILKEIAEKMKEVAYSLQD